MTRGGFPGGEPGGFFLPGKGLEEEAKHREKGGSWRSWRGLGPSLGLPRYATFLLV